MLGAQQWRRGESNSRIKVATKTTDKLEAQRIADRLDLEAREGKEKRKAGVSHNGLNAAIQKATQLATSGRLDAHAARDLINNLLTAAGQETLDAVTNRVWCDNWRAAKVRAVKQRSLSKYDQVCRDWLAFLNGRADKPLEAVGKAEVIAYRDRLAKAGLVARTVNQTLKLLRGIYADAVEQGHLGRNPFVGVDSLREKAEESRRLPFTVNDVASLIATAEGDWKGFVIVAATTGLRLMDAARLTWRNLDIDAAVIRVKTAKTGAALTLPIHSAFAQWLAAQQRGIAAAPVFPTLVNKRGAGKSGLSMAFKHLMGRAKIASGVAREGEGRGKTTSQKSFHSLRHFAATQLASSGVRADVARQITGHADAASHAGYVSPDIDALRVAVANIRLSA